MENRQRGTVKTMKRGCWPRLPVGVWRCPGETAKIRLFNTILERERMPEFKYLWLPIQSNRQCTRVVKKRVQAVSEWFVIEEQQQEWKARFARWWWDMLLCLVWRERREAGRWIFADFHWVRWVWRQSWRIILAMFFIFLTVNKSHWNMITYNDIMWMPSLAVLTKYNVVCSPDTKLPLSSKSNINT